MDGHLNKCKTCTKMHSKNRTDKKRNDPAWIESEKVRGRDKYHRLYKGNTPNPEVRKRALQKYKASNPEKIKASNASENLHCPENHHKHHWSYNEAHWLDVIIIPTELHYRLHRNLVYSPADKMYSTKNGELLNSREKHVAFMATV